MGTTGNRGPLAGVYPFGRLPRGRERPGPARPRRAGGQCPRRCLGGDAGAGPGQARLPRCWVAGGGVRGQPDLAVRMAVGGAAGRPGRQRRPAPLSSFDPSVVEPVAFGSRPMDGRNAGQQDPICASTLRLEHATANVAACSYRTVRVVGTGGPVAGRRPSTSARERSIAALVATSAAPGRATPSGPTLPLARDSRPPSPAVRPLLHLATKGKRAREQRGRPVESTGLPIRCLSHPVREPQTAAKRLGTPRPRNLLSVLDCPSPRRQRSRSRRRG